MAVKYKDFEWMYNRFREEFHEGCDALRGQKNIIQATKSVFNFIDFFDSHMRRMLKEQFGTEE